MEKFVTGGQKTFVTGGHVTSRDQGLSSNEKRGREERAWERGWNLT